MSDVLVRELEFGDLDNGFLKSLDSLRKATGISKEKATEVFEEIRSNPNHTVLVALSDGRVIGATTLLVESKFIHGGSKIGHIEDVSVDAQSHGTGAGSALIRAALEASAQAGCYKTVLDCQDDVIKFYEKMGFKESAHTMRFEH